MKAMSKKQLDRLGEKLQRLAYELEDDASRLRDDGTRPTYAAEVRAISSRLGRTARSMFAEIT